MQKYYTLNNGKQVPAVGLGTFQAEKNKTAEAVSCAIASGYRLIDCAAFYGNESEVGEAVKKQIDAGIVNREDLFITSKLWNTDHAVQHVRPACEATLRDLKLPYIDLYLIHWPVGFKFGGSPFRPDVKMELEFDYTALEDTWKEMEKLVEAGLVRSIGVSNFNEAQIDRIFKICKIQPVMLQVEVHIHLLNEKLISHALSKGMQVTAYAPFGSPALMTHVKSPLDDDHVKQMATKYDKTPGQVLIRHALERGICVIPKSVTPERIVSNFQVFDFILSKDEMDLLKKNTKNIRLFSVESMKPHPEYPFADKE